jgi:hypothetical protein
MSQSLSHIPAEHLDAIRQLASEGSPVGRIAFLTHMSETTVRECLAASVDTTKEGPARGGAGSTEVNEAGAVSLPAERGE